jgi:hypothetical protein
MNEVTYNDCTTIGMPNLISINDDINQDEKKLDGV